jgi:hypothetical protein
MPRIGRFDLIVEYYGLDAKTLAVDSLAIAKQGLGYRWTAKGYIERTIGLGTTDEISNAFGLIELVAVAPATSPAARKKIIADLEGRKAALIAPCVEQERSEREAVRDDSASVV